MIRYGQQAISQADIDAVVDVLRGDWLTQGPAVENFERAMAHYCGAVAAVAVSSGTAALHLACRAVDFGPGDMLWTSPNTFAASANCAGYCGGDVDFVDIDPRTYNLSTELLAEKLRIAERDGRLPKVVVPVHFAGQSCDMAAIHALSQTYGFRIVEDASHALGGRYRDDAVGACRYSDMTVFSFHPVKIITTGEGGAVLTNDRVLQRRLVQLRSHGVTRGQALSNVESHGGWYYEQTELGFNYRLTDLQAALGLSQLGRIDEFISRRRELAARYDEALSGLPLTAQWQGPAVTSSRHLYPIQLHAGAAKRRQVYDCLRAAGIGVQVHYIPVHLHPYYRALGFANGDFPNAEHYYGGAISLPLHPSLSDADQARVIETLGACCEC